MSAWTLLRMETNTDAQTNSMHMRCGVLLTLGECTQLRGEKTKLTLRFMTLTGLTKSTGTNKLLRTAITSMVDLNYLNIIP